MFFCFNDTATTEIYTLSLHDALPISGAVVSFCGVVRDHDGGRAVTELEYVGHPTATEVITEIAEEFTARSEEHTSELQSRQYLVCRLLLEKKKNVPCC